MKQIFRYVAVAIGLILICVAFMPENATAESTPIEKGLSWLSDQQNKTSGAWGSDTIRETATVVDVLKDLDPTGAAYSNGVEYLQSTAPVCTDHLSRKIVSLAGAGRSIQNDVKVLLSFQNPDGGFGFAAGLRPSSVTDSLLADQALAEAGITDQTIIGKLLYYLTHNQNTDGSFGFIRGEGNLYLTAYAAQVLSKYQLHYSMKPYIDNAIKFLSGFKQADGSFTSSEASPVLTTAMAARALVSAGGSATSLLNARVFLLDQQEENGSWEDDPVATALALQALWHDESQEENPDNGTIIDPDDPRPNLTIDAASIRIIPANPVDGELATVTFTVLNTGSAVAENVDVALYAESPLISGATVIGRLGSPVASIAPESSIEKSISWRVVRKTGREAVYLFVDPDNTVNNESNKNDNIVSQEFTVSTVADLSINPADITFDNPAPFAGESFTMSAIIRNIGETDVEPVKVNVYRKDAQGRTLIGALNFSGITGGSFATANINLSLNAGIYTFEIEALPIDAAPANNTAQASITVQTTGFRGIDLSVVASEISISPENPTYDAYITLNSVIRNLGDQDAHNVTVTMYDGDPNKPCDSWDPENTCATVLLSHTFDTITGGGYKSVFTQRYGCLQPGNHDIYVVVDPVSSELSRINNTAHKAVTVYPPEYNVSLSITADNITFDPAMPLLGETVAIKCNFRNNGDLGVENLKVRAYDGEPENGGVELCPEIIFPYINPRSTSTLTINKDTTDWGGLHEIYIFLDPDNSSGDTDRNDNRASRQLFVGAPQSIDLAIEGREITVTPPDPVWGTVVQLHCPIHNYGTEPAEGAYVEFFNGRPELGGVLIDNVTISDSINPGDFINASVQWDTTAKPGQQSVFVRVSALPAGSAETNIYNNSAETYINVKAPDLSIQSEDISFAPWQPLAGEELTIQCLVRNIGQKTSGSYTLNFYKNSTAESDRIRSVPCPAIATGGSDNVSFQWIAPPSEGTCKIYVVIKPNAADANSDNNIASRTIYTTTPADLVLENSGITVEPNTPALNKPVSIRAEIKNTGGIDAIGATVGFYDGAPAADDSNRIGDEQRVDIYSHSSGFSEKTFYLNTQGSHNIYVVVNQDRSIHESNYGNNQAFALVDVYALADLEVRSDEIDITPLQPSVGDVLTISALVRNHGTENYAGVAVRFYDGPPETGGAPLGPDQSISLAGGQTGTVRTTYPATVGGLHTFVVIADPNGTLTEVDKSNNRAQRQVVVQTQEPDLAIVDGQLSFSSMSPQAGEPVVVTAKVYNCGNSDAGPFEVWFYDGAPGSVNPVLGRSSIGSLAAHNLANASSTLVLKEGVHQIYAVVDPLGSVAEANKNNNEAYGSITVAKLDGFYDDCGNPRLQPHLYQDPQNSVKTDNITIANVSSDNPLAARTASRNPTSIKYKYTGLNPGSSYQVVVNYLQETGGNRIQRLSADGILIHDAMALPENKFKYFIYDLPQNSYLDGSVILSFEKISGLNALVSEIYILEKQGKKEKAVSKGANWLVSHQSTTGGWPTHNSAFNNAFVLQAFVLTNNKNTQQHDRLKQRIYDTQASNGSWSDVRATAYTIIALIEDGESHDSPVIKNAINYLVRYRNIDNGSWGNNYPATGLAIVALIKAQVDRDSDYVQVGKKWLIQGKNANTVSPFYWGESPGDPPTTGILWYPVGALVLANTVKNPVSPNIINAAVTFYMENIVMGESNLSACLQLYYYTNYMPTGYNIEDIKTKLKNMQLGNGGWPASGLADPWETANALVALRRAGEQGSVITHAVDYLLGSITDYNDYPSIGEDAATSGTAATALHISCPSDFTTEKQKAISRFIQTQNLNNEPIGSWSYILIASTNQWAGGIGTVPAILEALSRMTIDYPGTGKANAIANARDYLKYTRNSEHVWPSMYNVGLSSDFYFTCWAIISLVDSGGLPTDFSPIPWLLAKKQNNYWGGGGNCCLAIIALSKSGFTNEASTAVGWLKGQQNADGGYGSILNTSWVVLALSQVGEFGREMQKGVAYLLSMQNSDGGWPSFTGTPESTTINTAMAAWALAVSKYKMDIDLELLLNKPYYYPGDKVKMAVNVLNMDSDNMSVNGNVMEYSGSNVPVVFTDNADTGKNFTGSYIVRSDHVPGTDTVSVTATADGGFGVTAGTFIVKNGEGVKPDPAILPENITFAPSAPHENEIVKITAKVTNTAVRDAINVRVYCYDGNPLAGGRLIDNTTIERVCGLDGVDVSFNWPAVSGGHEIYIILYPDPAIGDLYEGNNQAFKALTVEETPAEADLVIYSYDVTADPETPVEVQPVTIRANVRNIGGSASQPAVVRFTDSTGQIGHDMPIPAITSGDNASVEITWQSLGKPGRNYIHIIANPLCQSRGDEARCDNNETVKIIDVAEPALPNLSIRNEDISFSPANPLEAEPVEISARVTNWGTPASGFLVRFYDGEPAGAHIIGESYVYETLYFGATATVQAQWDSQAKAAGGHTVFVVVDPDGAITEKTVEDNTAHAELSITSSTLRVTVAPDRQYYPAQDNATLQITIESLDGSSRSLALDVVIQDSSGAVVGTPAANMPVDVWGSTIVSEIVLWNTGALPPGSYTAWAAVREGDAVQKTASAGFTITADMGLAARVTTDHAHYYGHEKVALAASVRSYSVNYTFTDLHTRLRIMNAAGTVLHADNSSITVLPPLQTEAFTVQWSTAALPPGIYSAVLDVTGDGVAAVSNNTTFSILSSQTGGKVLQAAVSISPEQVHAGAPAMLAWHVTNAGNMDLPDVAVTLSVMDVAAQHVVDNDSTTCSLNIGTSCNGTKTIDTAHLPPGDYVVILSASAGETLQTLAFTRFSLFNQCPVAVAGPDSSAFIGRAVAIDGSGSFDPDNDTLSYHWAFADKPQGSMAQLSGEETAACSFTPDRHGQYVLDLIAGDGFCESPADRVIVTTQNRPPLAQAGVDKLVHVGDTIALDAGLSSDPDNDSIVGWQWALTKPDGSTAQLATSDARSTAFTIDKKGEYRISLKVFDGIDWSVADETVITAENRCPVAEAGSDRLALVGNAAQVDGSGSFDSDGDALTYGWRLVDKPLRSTAGISGETNRSCSITPDRRGDYVLELVVRDGACASTADRVIVSTENRPPVALAGEDKLGHVGDTIALDAGASSDPDNDTLTGWQWEFVQPLPAGSLAQLTTPAAAITCFTIDRQGEYRLSLKVFDGLAWSQADEVIVSTDNRCPVADAGDNQTARAGQVVHLDGRGSRDPDNDRITYHWALNAPQGSTAAFDNASSAAPKFTPGVNGRYVAVLIVNDGICDSQPGRVTITTVNTCPAADAGDDRSAETGQTITLDGSGSTDSDNDSITYSWALSAPQGSATALANPATAHPAFIPDKAGMYTATLVVSDGVCSSSADSVSITVAEDNPLPDCNDLPVPASPCAMKTDYGPGGTASDAVSIASYTDYKKYESSNYGYKNGKYKNLKVTGSITMSAGDLVMHSPAAIVIGKNVKLKAPAGAICLDGRMGIKTELVYLEAEQVALMSQAGDISLGKGAHVDGDELYVSAAGSATLEDNVLAAVDGPVTMLSTGLAPSASVEIKQAAAIAGHSLFMRGAGSVRVWEFAALDIAGPMRMVTTGAGPGSQVWVKYGAAVRAGSLCISGPEEVSIGPASIIDAGTVSIMSTGDTAVSKASIKPATIVKATDMMLSGEKAWLEPFSMLLIRSR